MTQTHKYTKLEEIGATGLTRFAGTINEEWYRKLQGSSGRKKFVEMRDNSPICGAIGFAIKNLSKQAVVRIEPASDKPIDIEVAEFVEGCLHDMSSSWHGILSEILSFLDFGFSYHEIVYKQRLGDSKDPSKRSKYNDGRIGWRKLPTRSQESLYGWLYSDDNSLLAMQQTAAPDYKIRTIPIEKALLFRTESFKGNPEGRSIWRNGYRPYYFTKNIEEVEAIGVERDLAGLPIMQVPIELLDPNASPNLKTIKGNLEKFIRNVKRDTCEGSLVPSELDSEGKPTGFKFSLMSTGGRRQFDTGAIINRYEQRIAMSVLADFIMLGHEKVGSFALSSDKTKLFATAIGAFLNEIAEIFNTYAIPRLIKFNTFTGYTDYPKMVFGDLEKPELEKIGTFISSLTGTGVTFNDEEAQNYFRGLIDLPEITIDEDEEKEKIDDEPKEQ